MSASTATLGPLREERTARWGAAVVLTVLWHVVVVGLLDRADLFRPDEVSSTPEPVEIVFAPSAPVSEPASETRDEPEVFTELPEDRADLPPEQADALSNVDSRARDAVDADGPNTDLPQLEGRSDAPAVAMQPAPATQEQGAEGTSPDEPNLESVTEPQPESTAPLTAQGEAERMGRRSEIGDRVAPGETGEGQDAPTLGEGLGNPREALRRGSVEVSPEPRFLVGAGRDDVFQEEMDNPTGDAMLFGDVSLNTIAWDWAPWLQRFSREFYRNWVPPYAYFLGLIEGGQLVEIEVAPDGRLLRLDVLEEDGHESLREATVGNFRGFAPYQPLPEDFPEPTLRLTVRVTYPGRD